MRDPPDFYHGLLRLILSLTLAASAVGSTDLAGQERPGWVGVSMEIVTTSEGGSPRTFVRIADVQAGSPAARAGLRPGDLLLRVNDLAGPAELARLPSLMRIHVGDPVHLVVRREGAMHEAHLTAAERPAVVVSLPRPSVAPHPDSLLAAISHAMDSLRMRLAEGEMRVRIMTDEREPHDSRIGDRAPRPAEPVVWLDPSGAFSPLAPYVLGRNRVAGAEVIDVRPELARYFGVDRGVLVVDVPPGTPAATADLRPGDVIVELGGAEVESVRDLRVSLARPGEALPVWVVRRGERVRLFLGR